MQEQAKAALVLADEINRALWLEGLEQRVYVDSSFEPGADEAVDSSLPTRFDVWVLQPMGRQEDLLIGRDVRHGKSGYRIARYRLYGCLDDPTATLANCQIDALRQMMLQYIAACESKPDTWDWDESYQFYPTISELVAAIKTGSYEAGRKAF